MIVSFASYARNQDINTQCLRRLTTGTHGDDTLDGGKLLQTRDSATMNAWSAITLYRPLIYVQLELETCE